MRKFISTRSKEVKFTFEEVLFSGFAEDGGLIVTNQLFFFFCLIPCSGLTKFLDFFWFWGVSYQKSFHNFQIKSSKVGEIFPLLSWRFRLVPCLSMKARVSADLFASFPLFFTFFFLFSSQLGAERVDPQKFSDFPNKGSGKSGGIGPTFPRC